MNLNKKNKTLLVGCLLCVVLIASFIILFPHNVSAASTQPNFLDSVIDALGLRNIADFFGATVIHSVVPDVNSSYTITVTVGPNGSCMPSGAVPLAAGQNQTFTFTPNQGYQVSDVQVDGSSVGAVTSYAFSNVSANHTISVTFSQIMHNITISTDTNGSASPTGTQQVADGSNFTITFSPNSGYQIQGVTDNGSPVASALLSNNVLTLSNVTADHTVVATFSQISVSATPTNPVTPTTNGGTTSSTFTWAALGNVYNSDGTTPLASGTGFLFWAPQSSSGSDLSSIAALASSSSFTPAINSATGTQLIASVSSGKVNFGTNLLSINGISTGQTVNFALLIVNTTNFQNFSDLVASGTPVQSAIFVGSCTTGKSCGLVSSKMVPAGGLGSYSTGKWILSSSAPPNPGLQQPQQTQYNWVAVGVIGTGGSVTINGTATTQMQLPQGSTATIVFTPNSGYQLSDVRSGTVSLMSNLANGNTLILGMSQDYTISATFVAVGTPLVPGGPANFTWGNTKNKFFAATADGNPVADGSLAELWYAPAGLSLVSGDLAGGGFIKGAETTINSKNFGAGLFSSTVSLGLPNSYTFAIVVYNTPDAASATQELVASETVNVANCSSVPGCSVDLSDMTAVVGTKNSSYFSLDQLNSKNEELYAEIKIGEQKLDSNNVQFALNSAVSFYGDMSDYGNKYVLYDKNNPPVLDYNYVVETYDRTKSLMTQYVVPSSRFYFWDNQDDQGNQTGGIKETDSGVMDFIIPYRVPAYFIRINNNGVYSDYITLGAQSLQTKPQNSPCKQEGEQGQYGVDTCCDLPGLIEAQQPDGSFVCANCGDGVCSSYEDIHSCPQDCAKAPVVAKNNSSSIWLASLLGPFGRGVQLLLTLFAVFLVLAIIYSVFKFFETRK